MGKHNIMKIVNRILDIVLFYSKIFCDFGESFTVLDTNGEAVKSCLISYISHDNEGIVTTFEDQRHDLEDGSYVRFTDIKGMIELNENEYKIKVLSKFTLMIKILMIKN